MYQVIDKKKRLSVIILVLTVLTLVITVSYAYFQPTVGEGAATNTGIVSYKSDSLSFVKGPDLALEASQENFAYGMGNLTSTTTSSAVLKANTKTLSATDHYNVYLHIIKNNFEYTTNEEQPELVLKITDPYGEYLSNVEGLEYNNDLQGFDITTAGGVITLAENYEINSYSAAGEKQDWTFELSFINLYSNQALNEGKTIDAKVVLMKDSYVIPTLASGSVWSSVLGNDKTSITEINIVDSYTPTGNEHLAWDCSELNNGSVMCYEVGNKVIIAGNGTGHIFANPDSSYMFSDYNSSNRFESLTTINGLDILKTTGVYDMSNMFAGAGSDSDTFSIDISSWDMSEVMHLDFMFDGAGANASSWNVIIPPSNENGNYNDMTTIYGSNETSYYYLTSGREFVVASNV